MPQPAPRGRETMEEKLLQLLLLRALVVAVVVVVAAVLVVEIAVVIEVSVRELIPEAIHGDRVGWTVSLPIMQAIEVASIRRARRPVQSQPLEDMIRLPAGLEAPRSGPRQRRGWRGPWRA